MGRREARCWRCGSESCRAPVQNLVYQAPLAGLFGGRGATDVGGTLVINPIAGQNGIWEYGAFTLPRCDTAGASPLCNPR